MRASTWLFLSFLVGRLERVFAGKEGGLSACQRRNPPRNALALSPARTPLGSCFNFLTLPPPRTISSGSIAPARRVTTLATSRRHFLAPYFSNPRIPT